ncbi:cold shock domain-containing protein [Streptomyces sp. NPDC059875]|uniref:cold shock domain-containing protein n=1 Tax=unclassified Streptomyces TaxID=2593676 RepID=UPI0036695206
MKWFDADRGVGVIGLGGDEPDVLAGISAVHGQDPRLRQGEKVVFDITVDAAGRRADNIHRE